MTNQHTTVSSAARSAAGAPGAHQPGQWPHLPYTDELLTRRRQERARRAITLGAIRGHLEEQPSSYAIRACARQWCADITALAEDVITTTTTTEDAA